MDFLLKTLHIIQISVLASKASSDHFVRAYGETYGVPYIISNCSNNYGPYQFPEKLLPLFINNVMNNRPLPVYGDGNYTRDWLYVEDQYSCAIDILFHSNKIGHTYNIGGFNEWKNIDLVKELCAQMDKKLNKENSSENLIEFVKDRPGHDLRYAIDASKINKDLNWKPSVDFKKGLSLTIDWYLSNKNWLKNVTSGEYRNYYKKTILEMMLVEFVSDILKENSLVIILAGIFGSYLVTSQSLPFIIYFSKVKNLLQQKLMKEALIQVIYLILAELELSLAST